MQTEPLLTEPASKGHGAKSTPRNARADSTPLDVVREFQNFVADVEELIKPSASLTGDDLARAKASLHARVAAARAFAEQMPRAISARARNAARVADSHVRERPWRTMGITAAVGLLVGFLLGRRGQ
jgi:ElaB/YqjD/DUF883 family membrane-anchored ribosome-binding protein